MSKGKEYVPEPKEEGVNPKELQGTKKPPLHLIPPVAEIHMAMALKNGAQKYGAYNWRDTSINLTTYVGAIKRHINEFLDGEDYADDSGVHHLAHIMACCAIALDSINLNLAVDDRPPKGTASELIRELTESKDNEGDTNTPLSLTVPYQVSSTEIRDKDLMVGENAYVKEPVDEEEIPF